MYTRFSRLYVAWFSFTLWLQWYLNIRLSGSQLKNLASMRWVFVFACIWIIYANIFSNYYRFYQLEMMGNCYHGTIFWMNLLLQSLGRTPNIEHSQFHAPPSHLSTSPSLYDPLAHNYPYLQYRDQLDLQVLNLIQTWEELVFQWQKKISKCVLPELREDSFWSAALLLQPG